MKVFPSLSTDGYVLDRTLIIRKVMETFITSFKSQSNIFDIHSYQYIITNYEQGLEVTNAIDNSLQDMYAKYFDKVEVNTTYNMNNDDNFYIYHIDVKAWYGNQKYELEKMLVEKMIMS